MKDPKRSYIRWGLFYIIVVLAVMYTLMQLANGIHTYNTPVGTVELKIPYNKYLVGETISFAVTNNYNSAISVANNCPEEPLAVYKLQNKKWVRIHDKAKAKDCKDKSRFIDIPAGKTVQSNFKSWPKLFSKPGKYRVAVFIEYFNTVAYQDFEVIKKPAVAKTTQPPAVSSPQVSTPSSSRQSVTTPENDDATEEEDGSAATSPPSTPKKQTVSSGANSITVQYSATYITVLSINSSCPHEGGSSGSFVEVTFKCGGTETQIQLWLSGGVLRHKIEVGD